MGKDFIRYDAVWCVNCGADGCVVVAHEVWVDGLKHPSNRLHELRVFFAHHLELKTYGQLRLHHEGDCVTARLFTQVSDYNKRWGNHFDLIVRMNTDLSYLV